MLVNGKRYRTVQIINDKVWIIDQTRLPHAFELIEIKTMEAMERAIRSMQIRGAPAIGAAAAFGMYLAVEDSQKSPEPLKALEAAGEFLRAARPTAVNLAWAVEKQLALARESSPAGWLKCLLENAQTIADEEAAFCESIGRHGVRLIEEIALRKGGKPVNVLTHCNGGWLATVDYGMATGPIFEAQKRGIPIHVWVSETRPRVQGALTAWELVQQGVAHHVIVDNAAAIKMQQGEIDIMITGSDRTTRTGDVCNKVGTLLKAIAARHYNIPFYAALPCSTIDWTLTDGPRQIPIEERSFAEVSKLGSELLYAPGSEFSNPGFGVTPRTLVSGIITERGICEASERGLLSLYPERKAC